MSDELIYDIAILIFGIAVGFSIVTVILKWRRK